jgi:hypothetical protein
MAQAAQSRGFFGFLGKPQQKKNLFGWSKKEKTAKRKKISGGATEARGAGYRYATHKSDENFSEWMDRKDFGDEKSEVKKRLAEAFSMGFDRGKKEIESKEAKKGAKKEKYKAKRAKRDRQLADEQDRKIEREMKAKGLKNPTWGFGIYQGGPGFGANDQVAHFKSKAAAETWARSKGLKSYSIKRAFNKANPARSGAQYRLAQAILSGTARTSSMPRKVAQEIVSQTPAKLRSEYMKATGGSVNGIVPSTGGTKARNCRGQKNRGSSKKNNRRNPAADAAALSKKFHGRPATTERRIVEPMHVHKHLMEIGDLVRLVIDTPTGKVVVLNFNTSDPRKIVRLATSERDPKSGKLVGKQLYLRGGDQEVNLKALGMDSPLWIRDRMELGRLHEFKRGEPALVVDGERVKGSITYRTRKGMDDFKLVDYWHRAGEETARKAGPAARSIVEYDFLNKKIGFIGGQYHVDSPGIIN